MRPFVWILLIASCGSNHGTSQPSIPRVTCIDCDGPLSTFSRVELDSSWEGECWESNGECGGPIPTPGTPAECSERKFRCKVVDHAVSIHCDHDACRVSMARTGVTPGIKRSVLVLVKPGISWITATFDPDDGKPRDERMQVDVRRPDRAVARCSSTTVAITLFEGTQELRGTHTSLEVTTPEGLMCTQIPGDGRDANIYRCPSEPATVRLKAPDFEAEVPTDCA